MQIKIVRQEHQKLEDELLKLSELLTGGDVDVANKLKQLGQEERDQLFNDLVKVCRYVVQKLKYQKEHLDL